MSPLGEVKTKAPNSNYHNHRDAPLVAARQAEVARDNLKRVARISELNGHPPGSDGPMATALKRYNGGRVQHHRTRPGADPRQAHQGHVQAAHPEGLGAHGAPRLGPPPPQPRPGPHRARDLITHGPAHRGANGAAMPMDKDDQDGAFFFNHPERGGYSAA